MQLQDLANELVLHIFQSCHSVSDVLSLASTCHHFRKVLTPSRRLPILFQAAEAQLGPLSDAIQLVTHNTSQAAHVPRLSPPLSLALLSRLLSVGQIANKWITIYPAERWHGDLSSSRRLLSSEERYRLRRACYRLWLYSLAFHSPLHPRTTRRSPPIIRSRAALLRPWPTKHLAEMLDLHAIFRQVLTFRLCPSNVTVLRRHRARFPNHPAPVLIKPHFSLQGPRELYMQDHSRSLSHVSHLVCAGKHRANDVVEGWGDEISHYYVLEDMLKLDPGQLLSLYESVNGTGVPSPSAATGARKNGYMAPTSVIGGIDGSNGAVHQFVEGLGDWFDNNGETWVETMDWVVGERGEDIAAVREHALGGLEGIVKEEWPGE